VGTSYKKRRHSWWQEYRTIEIETPSGTNHTMNRYASPIEVNRPESYMTDERVLAPLSDPGKLKF